MHTLHSNDCLPCDTIYRLLDPADIHLFLQQLGSDWQLTDDQKHLSKKFFFENHYQIVAFVNDIAWMTHFKNHPPELEINRDFCLVRYSTTKVDGLSEFDFVCAHKVEHLFLQYVEKKK